MQGTLAERAYDGLHDYAIYLRERGDKSDWTARTRAERAEKPRPPRPALVKRQATLELLTTVWENERLRTWREEGRLTADGVLRVGQGALPRWTLTKVSRAFPELEGLDRWAVLIAADGVFRSDEMAKDPHQNIREVIEEIVDTRLKKVLREELAEIFGEVLVQVKANAPVQDEDRSTLRAGRKHQVHRVRHPVTKQLVSREERDAYLAAHPEAPAAAAAPGA